MSNAPESEFGEPEYLGYKLLEALYEVDNRPVSRSKFLKLACIADRRILDQEGLDIGFPRYWYKYGELASAHDISRGFFNAPSARFWTGQEYHPDSETTEHEFDVRPAVREMIENAVQAVVLQFGKKSVEEIKAHQYSNLAPNDFIETYSRMRAQFEEVNLNKQELVFEGGAEEYFEHLLDEMMDTFPRRRYDSVLDLYLRWDDTMRLMLESDADYKELHNLLDYFIEKLSEIVLRFEHNTNVSEARLEDWEDEIPNLKNELKNEIGKKRKEYLTDTGSYEELEQVETAYDELVSSEI